jgi:hypothetical protein
LRAFAIMLGEKEHRRAWDDVLYSIRTGNPAFDHVFGVPHFQYFASNPEAARVFNEGMTSRAGTENAAIVEAYDFSKCKTVIDVGGGQGTLLTAIKRTAVDIRTVLFDLPHVIAAEQSASAAQGHETASGSFFDFVPQGGDAYVLKEIIHDWDDERAVAILKNCRAVMDGTARLLLIEPVVPSGNAASFNKLVDLNACVDVGWQGANGKRASQAPCGGRLYQGAICFDRLSAGDHRGDVRQRLCRGQNGDFQDARPHVAHLYGPAARCKPKVMIWW